MTGPENLLHWITAELEKHLKADVGAILEHVVDPILQAGVAGVREVVHGGVKAAQELVQTAERDLAKQALKAAHHVLPFWRHGGDS